jgi:hypothetical protein
MYSEGAAKNRQKANFSPNTKIQKVAAEILITKRDARQVRTEPDAKFVRLRR